MNGLLTHSNLSLDSFRAPSIISLSTDSSRNSYISDDRVHGIGAISGRAVMAVGQVALRGMEHLAIRRKLRTIKSFFPHYDDLETKDAGLVYDDVLELSRPGLYSSQVRKQALQVLLDQIIIRQTHHLIHRLLVWPTIEISLFVSELLACLPPEWLPPGNHANNMHQDLWAHYMSSINRDIRSSIHQHPVLPLIDFIGDLAETGDAACRAIFDSGFLDVLLCMCASNFTSDITSFSTPGPSSLHTQSAQSIRDSVIDAGNSLLTMLCREPNTLIVVSAHPIAVIWPKNRRLVTLLGRRTKERHVQWQRLGHHMVFKRLDAARILLGEHILERIKLLDDPETMIAPSELAEVCIDLVGFTSHSYPPEITETALMLIQTCIHLRGSYWHALSKALSSIPAAENRYVFSRLFHYTSPRLECRLEMLARPQFSAISQFLAGTGGVYLDTSRSAILPIEFGGDMLDILPQVPVKYDASKACLESTREQVLEHITNWVGSDEESRIFWLYSMAGEGKSAIAHSISKWLDEPNPRGHQYTPIYFFFSRHNPPYNCLDFLFSTLAHQLAQRSTLLGQHIRQVLLENPQVAAASPAMQFAYLVLGPLRHLQRAFPHNSKVIFILDGIDECGDEATRMALRTVLGTLSRELPVYVKFFVTSRPSRDLCNLFDTMGPAVERYNLSDVPTHIVDSDITTYVRARTYAFDFDGQLSVEDVQRQDSLRDSIVTKSCSVFLAASSIIDYPPPHVSELFVPWDAKEFRGLDNIYTQVLEDAFPQNAYVFSTSGNRRQFCSALGMIFSLKHISSPDILGILRVDFPKDVSEVLAQLRSVVTISEPDSEVPGGVRMLHPSLESFLSDHCPGRFSIDLHSIHAQWARGSLVRMHARLERNCCRLEHELSHNNTIDDLCGKLRLCLADDLRYACRHWSYHLSRSPTDHEELYHLLKVFLVKDVRKWLEILSLLDVLDCAFESLELCRQWILSYSCDDTLATWVSNIQRSMEEYRSDIKAVACYSHCFSITMSRSTSTDGIAFALLEESSQNALSEVASSHGDSQDISIADNHFLHEPTSARSRISTQSSDNSDALSYYSATSSSFHSEEDVEWEML